MSELSTVLISDSRYNDITSSVTIGVKDGPASVIHQNINITAIAHHQLYLILTFHLKTHW